MGHIYKKKLYNWNGVSNLIIRLQVTRFKFDGVCLGIGVHHELADGFSVIHFLNTWSAISRGKDIAVAPSIDRRILSACNPPHPQFPHVEYQTPPTSKSSTPPHNSETIFSVFKIMRDQLNALKNNCQYQDEQTKKVTYSTYEVLAGTIHIQHCPIIIRRFQK